MSDQQFIQRCQELRGTPWVAARLYLWMEGAGSYSYIEDRVKRLDPLNTREKAKEGGL